MTTGTSRRVTLAPATLALPDFQERSHNYAVAAFLKSQRSYSSYYATEGAKEMASWSNGAQSKEEMAPATAVLIGRPSSPILRARVDSKLATASNQDVGKALNESQKQAHLPASQNPTPRALPKHVEEPQLGAEIRDGQDEHVARLAERKERRRAKAAILKPKPVPSPAKLVTSRKRKPVKGSPSSSPTKPTEDEQKEETNLDPVQRGKRSKSKKKQKVVPPAIALLHGLTPNNIGKDRLTLKPAPSIGVFNKGKASAKIQIKDHRKPDNINSLVFSESRFFNKTRQPDSVRSPSPVAQREVSNYFKQGGKENREVQSGRRTPELPAKDSSPVGSPITSWSESPKRARHLDEPAVRKPDNNASDHDAARGLDSNETERVLPTVKAKWHAAINRKPSADEEPGDAKEVSRSLHHASPVKSRPGQSRESPPHTVGPLEAVPDLQAAADSEVAPGVKAAQEPSIKSYPAGVPDTPPTYNPTVPVLAQPRSLSTLASDPLEELINACAIIGGPVRSHLAMPDYHGSVTTAPNNASGDGHPLSQARRWQRQNDLHTHLDEPQLYRQQVAFDQPLEFAAMDNWVEEEGPYNHLELVDDVSELDERPILQDVQDLSTYDAQDSMVFDGPCDPVEQFDYASDDLSLDNLGSYASEVSFDGDGSYMEGLLQRDDFNPSYAFDAYMEDMTDVPDYKQLPSTLSNNDWDPGADIDDGVFDQPTEALGMVYDADECYDEAQSFPSGHVEYQPEYAHEEEHDGTSFVSHSSDDGIMMEDPITMFAVGRTLLEGEQSRPSRTVEPEAAFGPGIRTLWPRHRP